MDVKKLGAVVGGAALLASSVAFGAVLYEDTTLVDANGQIVAKVVVGENAAASDGVGAAKIAAALASKAFKPVTYTAQVEGSAVCTATTEEATGTCTVTDQRADIAVIMPGLTTTAIVSINPLIAEELDQELGDREYSDVFDVVTELWDDDANPYQDQIGGTGNLGGGPDTVNATLVDYRNFDAFRIWDVTGKYLDGQGIEEKERTYILGYTWYDAGDNDVKFKLNDIIYQAVFGPSAQGLPLCPGEVDTAFWACSSDKRIESSRAEIRFLGEKWYITKVEIPLVDVTWENDEHILEVAGTKVYLAKEAQYGIVNVGEYLETPDGKYKVRLDDINKNDIQNNPAIISVLDENNETLVQDQITPGETKELALPGGESLRIHVYQTAPGHALQAKWAEMALLEDSIVLEDSEDFMYDDDTLYTVYIGLANSNADGTLVPARDATHLKYIALATASLAEDLPEGSEFYLADVEGYKNFVFTYEGLEDVPTSTLTVKYRTSEKTGTLADGVTDFTVREYLEVDLDEEVRLEDVSDGTAVVGSKKVDVFYYVVDGDGVDEGDILLRADGEWYMVEGSGATLTIEYKPAGSNGKIHLEDTANTNEVAFHLEEDIGDLGGLPAYRNISVVSDFDNDKLLGLNNLLDDEVTWNADGLDTPGFGYTANYDYETPFISPRGTEVKGSGDYRTFEVPESPRRVELYFEPAGEFTIEPNMAVLANMTEGEEREVPGGDGLKVKVLKFYAEVSGTAACPTPEADMTGVTAVIYEGDTRVGESVTAYQPAYLTTYPTDVVVLDTSDAANAATVISVGGPVVNQKTAELLQGSDATLSEEERILVKQVAPGKIVVAGWTAEDTLQAVDQFLGKLTVN